MVLERLGAGGMGVVYAAWDPQLDRKVALKLVRTTAPSDGPDERSTRLLAEARVLARLSHPRVVAVHDVGTFLGKVFLAMEFVPGGSLAHWLQTPRPWALVVARFLEAGEGLAAAHAAGLVHRDFKAENVLLDARGRALVTDFGLAVDIGAAGTGLGGTAGYLAPERLAHQAPTPASDQFSFCVALYRALTRALPFQDPGGVPAGPAPFPPERAVPPWLRRVVSRGLALRPEDRFASMEALLEALAADPARNSPARRQRLLGVAGALALLGAAVLAATRESPAQRLERECLERVDRVSRSDGSGARLEQVRQAFTRADTAQGPDAFERTARLVEPELAGWARLASQACRLPTQAAERARLERCLEERRRTLHSLVELFRTADPQVVENAVTTTTLEVVPVATCERLALPAPSADGGVADEGLLSELARARVLSAAGRYLNAQSAALACAEHALSLGDRRVEAEARTLAGSLLAEQKRPDAEEALRAAIVIAEAAGADEQRARAWLALVAWYSEREAFEQARNAARNADALCERLGRPAPLEALRLNQLGQLFAHQGDTLGAAQVFERAVALRRAAFGADHPLVARSLTNFALTLPPGRARPLLEEVLASRERALGPRHPETALAAHNLGVVLLESGDCEAALGVLRQALAIRATQPGEDRVRLGRDEVMVSAALRCLHREPEALEQQRAGVDDLRAGGAAEAELRRQLEALVALLHDTQAPDREQSAAREALRALREE